MSLYRCNDNAEPVEAMRYDGTASSAVVVIDWCRARGGWMYADSIGEGELGLMIRDVEVHPGADVVVFPGDWVIFRTFFGRRLFERDTDASFSAHYSPR